MKNILHDKPSNKLHGRLLYSTKFIGEHSLKGKVILDIGCGYGWFETFAIGKKAKRIDATEISENDLYTIRSNINNPKVVTTVASAVKLPFQNKSFDIVVSWEVLEHIPRNTELRMFSEIKRVLKPDGVFVLSTPYSSVLSFFSDPAWWFVGHRHYSRNDLISYSQQAGLFVEKIEVKGKIWELIGNLNMYFCKWILRRKPLFEKEIQKKIDQEYSSGSGYMTMLAMFKK